MEEINKTKKTIKEKTQSAVSDVKKNLQKKKKSEKKIELERTYVVPLRKGFLKVPRYKRGKKAIKVLKEFLAKNMKVEDRDLNKVKIDIYLNNEIWFRGIKKPLHKVKVIAKKIDGVVYAQLAEIPEIVKYKMDKDLRKKGKVDKSALQKVVTKEAEEEKIREQREEENTNKNEKAPENVDIKQEFAKSDKSVPNIKPASQDKLSSTTQRKALKK